MLNILHIASFSGNLGDNFNHLGLVPWIQDLFGAKIKWKRLEIRKFYWKHLYWDENFVDYANKFDLIIIGGGNYFELWVEKSPTGTSIEIDPILYEKIKTPVFFNALGVDAGQGASETCVAKFQNFIDVVSQSGRALLSVRNDGAKQTITNTLGKKYSNVFGSLPDHGFFVGDQIQPVKKQSKKYICINLACDMLEVRFSKGIKTLKLFVKEISNIIEKLSLNFPEYKFTLMPHTYGDLKVMSMVLEESKDELRRNKIEVYHCGSGDDLARDVLKVYRNAELAIGMRFHANVCPISLGIPNLGISTYPQIDYLYDELKLENRLVNYSNPHFSNLLYEYAFNSIINSSDLITENQQVMDKIRKERRNFEYTFKNWWDKVK